VRRFASLRGRREFALVLRRGKAASSNSVNVISLAARDSATHPRVGIIVTTKVGGAVVRNRLRRRCKAILDQHVGELRGQWLVIACKPPAAALSYAALRSDVLRTLHASTARVRQMPAPAEPRR